MKSSMGSTYSPDGPKSLCLMFDILSASASGQAFQRSIVMPTAHAVIIRKGVVCIDSFISASTYVHAVQYYKQPKREIYTDLSI